MAPILASNQYSRLDVATLVVLYNPLIKNWSEGASPLFIEKLLQNEKLKALTGKTRSSS